MTVEITRTAKHQFTIGRAWNDPTGPYYVSFSALHPKTGKPWQKTHRVTDGADVQVQGYSIPTAYSTFLLALEARDRHPLSKGQRIHAQQLDGTEAYLDRTIA